MIVGMEIKEPINTKSHTFFIIAAKPTLPINKPVIRDIQNVHHNGTADCGPAGPLSDGADANAAIQNRKTVTKINKPPGIISNSAIVWVWFP